VVWFGFGSVLVLRECSKRGVNEASMHNKVTRLIKKFIECEMVQKRLKLWSSHVENLWKFMIEHKNWRSHKPFILMLWLLILVTLASILILLQDTNIVPPLVLSSPKTPTPNERSPKER
jgi:hypothetical protein